jgi:hypothetical protein
VSDGGGGGTAALPQGVGGDLNLCRGRWQMGIVVLKVFSRRNNIGKDKSPNSMAQIPVPVAMSRTFWGLMRGARCSLSSMVMTNK